MNMRLAKVRIWFLFFCVAGFLFFYGLQNNWTLHARLNLLLHGQLWCRLVSPSAVKEAPLPHHTSGFIAMLVYENGKYLRSLDSYGNFIPITSNDVNWTVHLGITTGSDRVTIDDGLGLCRPLCPSFMVCF